MYLAKGSSWRKKQSDSRDKTREKRAAAVVRDQAREDQNQRAVKWENISSTESGKIERQGWVIPLLGH